jgi:hypothetical protein
MTRHIGISVPHRRVEDDDDIQDYVKPWVGLSTTNIIELWNKNPKTIIDFARAIEQKLKERNT